MLRGSQTEFPDNRSLSDLKKKLDEAVARRTEVQSLLNTARRLFGESSWKQGGEACVRAVSLAARIPGCASRLSKWRCEPPIQPWRKMALRRNSGAGADRRSGPEPRFRILRSRIAEKKREQAIQDAVAEVRRLQSVWRFAGALEWSGKISLLSLTIQRLKGLQAESSSCSVNRKNGRAPGTGEAAAAAKISRPFWSSSSENLGVRRRCAFWRRPSDVSRRSTSAESACGLA